MEVHAETQTGSILCPPFVLSSTLPTFVLLLSHAFLLDSSSSIKNWSSIIFFYTPGAIPLREPSFFQSLPSPALDC